MDGLRRKLPSPGALFVFEAAARHENFTRAAQELNVTQPAVSRALAGLEAHLGARLFQREKPGARLTEDGRILQAAVSTAFSGINDALHRIDERRTGKTQITLSVSTAFTTHWLMPRIARFHAAFPEVDLRFQLIPGPIAGPAGNVDIAMRYAAPDDRNGRFVMHEAYCPVCAPDTPRPGDSALICLEGERPAALAQLLPAPPPPEGALVFSDYAVVVQAALLGQGIATGWLNVVSHWMAEGRLVPAASRLVRPGRSCRLMIRQEGDHARTVAAIADWILAELQRELHTIARRYPDLGIDTLIGPPA